MKMPGQNTSFRTIFLWGLLGFVIVAIVFTFIYTELKLQSKAALPRISLVPDFTLMERTGQKIPLSDLKGKAWIADFIFTNCGGSCPLMSSRMANFQEQLKNDLNILLVSFTVDPERDTPEALKDYAEMYNASASRWLFLTGDKEKLQYLTRDGFHLGVSKDSVSAVEPIIHSTMFVLVDRQGVIRGYYDSDDNVAMDKLIVDVRSLASEKN